MQRGSYDPSLLGRVPSRQQGGGHCRERESTLPARAPTPHEEDRAQMYDDEPTKYVAYEKFEARAVDLLREGTYAPDIEETLLAAFRVSDQRVWMQRGSRGVVLCRCLTRRIRGKSMQTGCSPSWQRTATRGLASATRRWTVSTSRGSRDTVLGDRGLAAFMALARDSATGKILYEDYVAKVIASIESIHN
jgi:hypothetical protein